MLLNDAISVQKAIQLSMLEENYQIAKFGFVRIFNVVYFRWKAAMISILDISKWWAIAQNAFMSFQILKQIDILHALLKLSINKLI